MNVCKAVAAFLTLSLADGRLVVNTWSGDFETATESAYRTLVAAGTNTTAALDAVETGCKTCEQNQCDTSVGYGNHPDTRGFTSLDAMIMDGDTFDVGSVGYIRKFRDAISIARHVMVYTSHTLLVGEGAEHFALMMGLPPISATDDQTTQEYESWKDVDCQPNFYENIPEAHKQCGPYNISDIDALKQSSNAEKLRQRQQQGGSGDTALEGRSPYLDMSSQESAGRNADKHPADGNKDGLDTGTGTGTGTSASAREGTRASKYNHDTIGMVVIDEKGSMACGTTTNGANHKVAGRVGDSPITGSGCYVDSTVGGAAATGDGDIMMRFLPAFYAVNLMSGAFGVGSGGGDGGKVEGRGGLSPTEACEAAISRIVAVFPDFSGGMVCVNSAGEFGGAAHNMAFTYSYASDDSDGVQVVTVAEVTQKYS